MRRLLLGSISLAAMGLATAATAQTALPDIDVRRAPVAPLSHRPAAPVKPVVAAPAPASAPARAARPAPVRVAAPAPAPAEPAGASLSVDKLPTTTINVSRADLDRDRAVVITETLQRKHASVATSDVAGNPFQPDLTYRGFTASSVPGTPQGLAVYMDGVRINEAFGDHVNFDLIPTVAIADTNIVAGNPIFGLNALGGAMVMEMKNGFTWQGYELDGRGGSYGRRYGSAQAGKQIGNFGAYAAFEAIGDDGWRKRSGSSVLRGYADLGYRAEGTELHASYSGATTRLGAAAATPVELLQRDWGAVYTTPQTTNNDAHFVNLKGAVQATSSVLLNGNFYFRQFRQQHVDGNVTEIERCSGGAFICQDDDDFAVPVANALRRLRNAFGQQIPASVLAGGIPGSIDSTRTNSRSYGGALQATIDEALAGHRNKLVIGGSFDRHHTDFKGSSELGIIQGDLSVASTGQQYWNQVAIGGFQPASVTARNLYYGVYALDSLDVTDKLTVTAGLRFNSAQISMFDRGGTVRLNSDAVYQRVNPTAGFAYNFVPEFIVYGNYSEANRAPTPLENGCSDPNNPCLIDNFLVSDPPLKQVVTRTGEIGFRGHHDFGPEFGYAAGRFDYKVGVFRAVNSDDILTLPSNAIVGRGYFANVGATRRDGLEIETAWHNDRLALYANYALIDATFRTSYRQDSEANPFSDEDGRINVRPGNILPGIPRHRVKLGFDWLITPQWKFGADYIYTSGVHLFGDEANLDRKVAGWGIVNLKTSYKVTNNVEVYAVAQNVGDRRYANFGTYFDAGNPLAEAAGLTNSRTLGPAAPVTVFGGVKVKF